MAIVENSVLGPDNNPVHGAEVLIELISGPMTPGFKDGATVGGIRRVVTEADGVWSADLIPNALLIPANTHYRVTEKRAYGKTYVYTIVVPDVGTPPFSVDDLLVTQPTPPGVLLPAGGEVASVDGRQGVVTLTDRYSQLGHTHAAGGHTHVESDVTGLVTDLAGKAASVHTHAQADVTNLTTALSGKAATSHSHVIADTTSLQSSLDGKSATGHNHTGTYAPVGAATVKVFNGSSFVDAPGAVVYVGGSVDPTQNNGDIWVH